MNVRKDIVKDLLLPRFAAITTANGYQSNIGTKLKHRHATDLDASQLDALVIFDTVDAQLPDQPSSGAKTWALTVIANVLLAPADDNEDKAYKAIQDINKAVAVDPRWNNLAKRTDQVSEEIKIAKDGTRVGGAQVIFKIITSRKPFAP